MPLFLEVSVCFCLGYSKIYLLLYYDDFRPLLEGCTCYCCQRHTRAYLHHLLVSNELLAGVLLMMHNFQHYFSFFSAIRDALRDNKLDQLKKLIFSQALQGPENAKIDQ
uniref:tRNA-guanine(15) transglycosylase-like domain-containing protein n=1 Tax=Pavo cristatus TaxID=9049 RepID=A0A8C9FHF7_PAVCR